MTSDKRNTADDSVVPDEKEKLSKISKIIFDEKTGTLMLKIASKEEIAEAEKMKNGKA